MAGLYPDNQMVQIFGEQVLYPGVDPVSGKFSDGDFSDPLKKPSYIPAGTMNLILDNLSDLIASMGGAPNNQETSQLSALNIAPKQWVKNWTDNRIWPVGAFYKQDPDMPSPLEYDIPLPGTWETWSHRAVLYGLSFASAPDYQNYYSRVGANVAVNTIVLYHKDGDDYRLYKCKTAHTAPAELDPVMWDYIQPGIIEDRQKCGNALIDDDFEIGHQITSGPRAGMYVTEAIVPGGKYPSIEGGYRPTFRSGGVQQDAIRNIAGAINSNFNVGNGAFSLSGDTIGLLSGNGWKSVAQFNASRVVPTAADNRVVTNPSRLWRRTA